VLVEGLAGGSVVGRDPGHVGWRRWGGSAGGFEDPSGGGGEDHPVGEIGVAGDPEQALVVLAVVVSAQADEVPSHRLAVVLPVDDVMDLDPQGRVAARDPAATVAMLHEPPDPPGHDPLAPSDLDGVAVAVPDSGDVAVAGQVPAQGRWEGGAGVHLGPPRVAVDRGLEVDQHPGPGGDLRPRRIGAQHRLGHPHHHIGPGDRLDPEIDVGPGRGPALGRCPLPSGGPLGIVEPIP
jgi:hypothetical protein